MKHNLSIKFFLLFRFQIKHNHPSGNLTPSKADKDVTDHLYQVGKFLNVPVLDHMIISKGGFYSFSDSGLLHELSLSLKYVPVYLQKKKALNEQREEFEKKTKQIIKVKEKDKAVEMAKVLLEEGVDVEIIVEASGLSKTAIGKVKKEELKGE